MNWLALALDILNIHYFDTLEVTLSIIKHHFTIHPT